MLATAAHLTDHVLPSLPVRQWVLVTPRRLRCLMDRDADLQGSVRRRRRRRHQGDEAADFCPARAMREPG